MTKISFYVSSVNSSEGLYRLLPSLLNKMLEKKHKILITCKDQKTVKNISNFLWDYSQTSFLPHGVMSDESCHLQPILVTDQTENVNNSDILISFGGREITDFSSFLNVFDIFDSSDEQLTAGRRRWKDYKEKGYELSYFTSENGNWIKKH